jgi:hypothetical protein
MMNSFSKFGMIAATLGLVVVSAAADARPNRVRVSGQNGVVTGVSGANGSAIRGRGAVQNADGSVTAASGGAFRTAAGGKGYRSATTTINPDGSANRRSSAAASGPRGSGSTSSNLTRNADGSYSGGRTSTATRASTGNTYSGSTQIDPATGKPVRTATCTNASGAVIACPR